METNTLIGFVFLQALLGSWHCVFMCGNILPIVNNRREFVLKNALYHVGKILSYAGLGIFFGLASDTMRPVVGSEVIIWIGLVAAFIFAWQFLAGQGLNLPFKFVMPLYNRVAAFRERTGEAYFSSVLLGSLSGLLPCGLVYSALGLAITLPNPLLTTLAMVGFGFGTLPALLLTSFLRDKLLTNTTLRPAFKAALIFCAVFFGWGIILYRLGMNAGGHHH